MPDELIEASAPIAVIGAGTMGAGIAQVAAVAGHPVLVYDAVPGTAERAVGGVRMRVAALVAKGRLDVDPARLRLDAVRALDELASSSGLRTVKVAVAGSDVPRALLETADLVLDGPGAAVGFLEALAARVVTT